MTFILLRLKCPDMYRLIGLMASGAGIIGLKVWYGQADVADLTAILHPTQIIIGQLSGEVATWTEEGYLYEGIGVIIGKSCSGFNFLITALMVSALTILQQSRRSAWMIDLMSALVISFVATLLANVSRIASLILIQQRLQLTFISESLTHKSIGAAIYLCFLIGVSYVLRLLFIKSSKNS